MSATLQEACYENTTAVYMALELSNKQWKVLIGDGHHHRHKTVGNGNDVGCNSRPARRWSKMGDGDGDVIKYSLVNNPG